MTTAGQLAIGALLGSAVGDALGAPFEFGPAGQFTKRFPTSVLGPSTEMIGGGGFGWEPGEFTDDTQMALILGESLLAHDRFDGSEIFHRFQQWARSAPDVGAQTHSVLLAGDWRRSATEHFERTGHAAGNGSLMRATTSALFAIRGSLGASIALARAQSGLTHGDPAAGWGAALYHGMVHAALHGRSPIEALPDLFELVPEPHRSRYEELLMADDPVPGEPGNGTVWTCLAQAVRVVRQASSFEQAMRRVGDVAGDVDTVACVTGGLAGAWLGIQSIPSRWLIPVVVHCHAGESRTGFVLRGWLMHDEQLDADEATRRLAELWPYTKHRNTDFDDLLHQGAPW